VCVCVYQEVTLPVKYSVSCLLLVMYDAKVKVHGFILRCTRDVKPHLRVVHSASPNIDAVCTRKSFPCACRRACTTGEPSVCSVSHCSCSILLDRLHMSLLCRMLSASYARVAAITDITLSTSLQLSFNPTSVCHYLAGAWLAHKSEHTNRGSHKRKQSPHGIEATPARD